jgi:hypothetical protein
MTTHAATVPVIARSRRFIIFIDRMFTTSLQRLFTNAFDVSAQIAVISCVYRARNAD